jgi:hypothetical protein
MSMSGAVPTLKADEKDNFYSWNKDRVEEGRVEER